MKINKIYNVDCIEGMKEMDADSVDTVITDPPYGLEFMGKDWDKFDADIRPFKEKELGGLGGYTNHITYGTGIKAMKSFQDFSYQWAVEAIRVLKPGGTMLCFGGTRTFFRMACGLEDAGFDVKDTLMWVYGSGFCKAMNIGKAMDKLQGNKREVVGIGKQGKKSDGVMAGNHGWTDGDVEITKGTSIWEGYYSHSMKPAYEPILLSMRQNDKTYVENALKHGLAGLNFDVCKTNDRYPTNFMIDETVAKQLGDKSRFFFCPKVSKAERNSGCRRLETENFHPTLKPLALLEYLCKLTRPPSGGVVLDPFIGSGTTAVACKHTNRDYIGFEKDTEYYEIAKARINMASSINDWM